MPRKAKDKVVENEVIDEKINKKAAETKVKKASTTKKTTATKTTKASTSTAKKATKKAEKIEKSEPAVTKTRAKKKTEETVEEKPKKSSKSTTKKPTTTKKASTSAAEKKTSTKKASTKKASEEKESKEKKSTAKKATTSKTSAKKTTKTAEKKTTTKKASATKTTAKKATTKKTSTTKKSTRKASKKAEEPIQVLEYYDLPYKYGNTIVKLLAQTPKTLFVYWEISDKDINNFKKQYGEDFFNVTKPILIVHNLTLNKTTEVEINDFANCWYLTTEDADCKFDIELARKFISNNSKKAESEYLSVAKSNDLQSPNDHIMFEHLSSEVTFKNYKTNETVIENIESFTFLKDIYKFYQDMYKDELLKNPSSKF